MKKVKIFSSEHEHGLETLINNFLSNEDVSSKEVEIHYSVAATSVQDGSSSSPLPLFSALIYYKVLQKF
ncbi:sporulation protein Cse60 [Paenibacillus sp. MCAF20]